MESRHSVLPSAEHSAAAKPSLKSAVDTSFLVSGRTLTAYRIANAVRRSDEKQDARVQPSRSWEAGGICLVIFLLAAGATFGFVCVHALRTLRNSLPLAPVATHQIADRSRESLGLHVEPAEHRLLITWNQRSAAVESASAGQLRIDDGNRHQTITLDENQIHTGAISYRAWTGDISLELSFSDASGGRETESYRILDDALARPPMPKSMMPQSSEVAASGGTEVPPQSSAPEDRTARASGPGTPSPNQEASPPTPAAADQEQPSEPPAMAAALHREEAPQLKQNGGATESPAVQNVSTSSPTTPRTTRSDIPLSSTSVPAPLDKPKPESPLAPSTQQSTVSPALGRTIPKPLSMVNPNLTPLRSVRIFKTCELHLYAEIDETGRVTSAYPLSVDRTIGPEMISASIAAARQWKFAPAQSSTGLPVKSHYSIVFRFQPAHR